MAVFDKTESLVMMPLCSAFTAADKTEALAASNIVEMSLQQWVGMNVALCCCRMNMPSAGCAKNAHEDKLILSAFITGNSSLEPLIEGLCAQIHVNLR